MLSHAAPPLLETERLTLRPFRPGDEQSLCSLWKRNRDRFLENFPEAVAQLADRSAGSVYIAYRAADWGAGTGFWYGMWDRASGSLLGQVHVKRLDWQLGRAELSYVVDRDFEGKGLATEAVRRVVTMCFDDLRLHKVVIRVIVGNERSAKLARRCGFLLEGTLRGEFLAAGTTPVDVHYFGLLATDDRPR